MSLTSNKWNEGWWQVIELLLLSLAVVLGGTLLLIWAVEVG